MPWQSQGKTKEQKAKKKSKDLFTERNRPPDSRTKQLGS